MERPGWRIGNKGEAAGAFPGGVEGRKERIKTADCYGAEASFATEDVQGVNNMATWEEYREDWDRTGEEPDYEPEEDEPYDKFFHDARKTLTALFEENIDAVYYERQLQVMHEGTFFHWVTKNALQSIKDSVVQLIAREINTEGHILRPHFYTHRSNRYPMRKINALGALIKDFSNSAITSSCGNRAEILFSDALGGRGFTHSGQGVNEYRGKKWTETGHNLDYIFEKDGCAYGCEIKNTLTYIDKAEMEIKLNMCDYLGVTPLFIMRSSPSTYNRKIITRGGFALLFVSQIYELSQADLVRRIREAFGEKKADCPRRIPEGIIDRFMKWHNKKHELPVNLKNDSQQTKE